MGWGFSDIGKTISGAYHDVKTAVSNTIDYGKSSQLYKEGSTKAQQLFNKIQTSSSSAQDNLTMLSFPSDISTAGTGNIIRFSFSLPSGSKYISNGKYKTVSNPTSGTKSSSYREDSKSNSIQNRFSKSYSKTTTYINMFMPDHIQYSNASNWKTSDLGIIGAGITAGMSLADGFNSDLTQSALGNAAKELGMSSFANAIQSVTSALPGIGSINAGDAVSAVRQTIANPYTEVIFSGVSNRTFSYTFKMTPRNATEQQTIARIVKEFRFHSAPEMKYENQNSYMTYPSEVDIEFIHRGGRNQNLPKISTCAITNVRVNYAPDGQYASHADGSPATVELTVDFIELETITKERLDAGY